MVTLSENTSGGASLSQHAADNARASPPSPIRAHADTSSHRTAEAPLGHLLPLMVPDESAFVELSPHIPQGSVLQGFRANDGPSSSRAGPSSRLPNDHITVREAEVIVLDAEHPPICSAQDASASSQDSGRNGARRKRRRLNNGSAEVITISDDDEPAPPPQEPAVRAHAGFSSVRERIANIRRTAQNRVRDRARASGVLQAFRDVVPHGSFNPDIAWGIDASPLVAQRTARIDSQNATIINATLPTIGETRRRFVSRSLRRTDSSSSIRPVHPETRRESLPDRYARLYQAFTDESSPVTDSFTLFSDMNRQIERNFTTSTTHETRPTRRRIFFRSVNIRRLANFQVLHEQRMRQRNAAPKDVIEGLPEVMAAEADTDIRCAICMSDVEVGENLRVLPCTHKYHKKCIGDWLTYNGSCPVDKKRICPFQRPV